MRILFICGSLEPGSDGVGDYTRLLASELKKNGEQVFLVALSDQHISEERKEIQQVEDIKIQVLRIPYSFSKKRSRSLVNDFIEDHNPDWISLQYVPYSFNNRGVPIGLPGALQKIGTGRNWHIMYHELWVGFTKVSSTKHRIIGKFQANIAKAIADKLNPKLVTTSNRLYQMLLLKKGVNAEILNLFSNIPFAKHGDLMTHEFYKSQSITHLDFTQYYVAGIFGTIYPGAHLDSAILEQLTIAEKKQKKLFVVGFGQVSANGLKEFELLKSKFNGSASFYHFGKLSTGEVSLVMQMIDVALSCTPAQHIGKSGVFAALKLHGVPVVIPEGDIFPEYHEEIKRFNKKLMDKPAQDWSVETVAKAYTSLLKKH